MKTGTDNRTPVEDAALWPAWEGARRAWLESKGQASDGSNTAKAYGIAFRQFFEWAGIPPWQVSPDLARAWARHMLREGLADRSINLKLSAMSSFYDFVQGGRELALWPAERRNPFAAVERPKVLPAYGRARFPSLEEVGTILAAINTDCRTGARDFALLYTILVTCRRAPEVLHMKWGDIQPLEEGGYALSYRDRGQLKQAALSPACYQAICAYLEMDDRPPARMRADDYIFVPMDPERVRRLPGNADKPIEANRPLSSSFANRILKKYAQRAGVNLEKAHLHGLRHAGAKLRLAHPPLAPPW